MPVVLFGKRSEIRAERFFYKLRFMNSRKWLAAPVAMDESDDGSIVRAKRAKGKPAVRKSAFFPPAAGSRKGGLASLAEFLESARRLASPGVRPGLGLSAGESKAQASPKKSSVPSIPKSRPSTPESSS